MLAPRCWRGGNWGLPTCWQLVSGNGPVVMTTAIGACGRYGKKIVGMLLSSSDLHLNAKPGFLTLRQSSVTRTKSTRGTSDGYECPASQRPCPHWRQGSCDRRSCGGAAVHRHGNRRHHDAESRTGRNRKSSHSCVSARQLQATHGQRPRPRPARPWPQRSGRKDHSWQAVPDQLTAVGDADLLLAAAHGHRPDVVDVVTWLVGLAGILLSCKEEMPGRLRRQMLASLANQQSG